MELLPSDYARLILGYLEAKHHTKSAEAMLHEIPELSEVNIQRKKGFRVILHLHEMTLPDMISDYFLAKDILYQSTKKHPIIFQAINKPQTLNEKIQTLVAIILMNCKSSKVWNPLPPLPTGVTVSFPTLEETQDFPDNDLCVEATPESSLPGLSHSRDSYGSEDSLIAKNKQKYSSHDATPQKRKGTVRKQVQPSPKNYQLNSSHQMKDDDKMDKLLKSLINNNALHKKIAENINNKLFAESVHANQEEYQPNMKFCVSSNSETSNSLSTILESNLTPEQPRLNLSDNLISDLSLQVTNDPMMESILASLDDHSQTSWPSYRQLATPVPEMPISQPSSLFLISPRPQSPFNANGWQTSAQVTKESSLCHQSRTISADVNPPDTGGGSVTNQFGLQVPNSRSDNVLLGGSPSNSAQSANSGDPVLCTQLSQVKPESDLMHHQPILTLGSTFTSPEPLNQPTTLSTTGTDGQTHNPSSSYQLSTPVLKMSTSQPSSLFDISSQPQSGFNSDVWQTSVPEANESPRCHPSQTTYTDAKQDFKGGSENALTRISPFKSSQSGAIGASELPTQPSQIHSENNQVHHQSDLTLGTSSSPETSNPSNKVDGQSENSFSSYQQLATPIPKMSTSQNLSIFDTRPQSSFKTDDWQTPAQLVNESTTHSHQATAANASQSDTGYESGVNQSGLKDPEGVSGNALIDASKSSQSTNNDASEFQDDSENHQILHTSDENLNSHFVNFNTSNPSTTLDSFVEVKLTSNETVKPVESVPKEQPEVSVNADTNIQPSDLSQTIYSKTPQHILGSAQSIPNFSPMRPPSIRAVPVTCSNDAFINSAYFSGTPDHPGNYTFAELGPLPPIVLNAEDSSTQIITPHNNQTLSQNYPRCDKYRNSTDQVVTNDGIHLATESVVLHVPEDMEVNISSQNEDASLDNKMCLDAESIGKHGRKFVKLGSNLKGRQKVLKIGLGKRKYNKKTKPVNDESGEKKQKRKYHKDEKKKNDAEGATKNSKSDKRPYNKKIKDTKLPKNTPIDTLKNKEITVLDIESVVDQIDSSNIDNITILNQTMPEIHEYRTISEENVNKNASTIVTVISPRLASLVSFSKSFVLNSSSGQRVNSPSGSKMIQVYRGSRSTPRNRNRHHIRALDFDTPRKTCSAVKKSHRARANLKFCSPSPQHNSVPNKFTSFKKSKLFSNDEKRLDVIMEDSREKNDVLSFDSNNVTLSKYTDNNDQDGNGLNDCDISQTECLGTDLFLSGDESIASPSVQAKAAVAQMLLHSVKKDHYSNLSLETPGKLLSNPLCLEPNTPHVSSIASPAVPSVTGSDLDTPVVTTPASMLFTPGFKSSGIKSYPQGPYSNSSEETTYYQPSERSVAASETYSPLGDRIEGALIKAAQESENYFVDLIPEEAQQQIEEPDCFSEEEPEIEVDLPKTIKRKRHIVSRKMSNEKISELIEQEQLKYEEMRSTVVKNLAKTKSRKKSEKGSLEEEDDEYDCIVRKKTHSRVRTSVPKTAHHKKYTLDTTGRGKNKLTLDTFGQNIELLVCYTIHVLSQSHIPSASGVLETLKSALKENDNINQYNIEQRMGFLLELIHFYAATTLIQLIKNDLSSLSRSELRSRTTMVRPLVLGTSYVTSPTKKENVSKTKQDSPQNTKTKEAKKNKSPSAISVNVLECEIDAVIQNPSASHSVEKDRTKNYVNSDEGAIVTSAEMNVCKSSDSQYVDKEQPVTNVNISTTTLQLEKDKNKRIDNNENIGDSVSDNSSLQLNNDKTIGAIPTYKKFDQVNEPVINLSTCELQNRRTNEITIQDNLRNETNKADISESADENKKHKIEDKNLKNSKSEKSVSLLVEEKEDSALSIGSEPDEQCIVAKVKDASITNLHPKPTYSKLTKVDEDPITLEILNPRNDRTSPFKLANISIKSGTKTSMNEKENIDIFHELSKNEAPSMPKKRKKLKENDSPTSQMKQKRAVLYEFSDDDDFETIQSFIDKCKRKEKDAASANVLKKGKVLSKKLSLERNHKIEEISEAVTSHNSAKIESCMRHTKQINKRSLNKVNVKNDSRKHSSKEETFNNNKPSLDVTDVRTILSQSFGSTLSEDDQNQEETETNPPSYLHQMTPPFSYWGNDSNSREPTMQSVKPDNLSIEQISPAIKQSLGGRVTFQESNEIGGSSFVNSDNGKHLTSGGCARMVDYKGSPICNKKKKIADQELGHLINITPKEKRRKNRVSPTKKSRLRLNSTQTSIDILGDRTPVWATPSSSASAHEYKEQQYLCMERQLAALDGSILTSPDTRTEFPNTIFSNENSSDEVIGFPTAILSVSSNNTTPVAALSAGTPSLNDSDNSKIPIVTISSTERNLAEKTLDLHFGENDESLSSKNLDKIDTNDGKNSSILDEETDEWDQQIENPSSFNLVYSNLFDLLSLNLEGSPTHDSEPRTKRKRDPETTDTDRLVSNPPKKSKIISNNKEGSDDPSIPRILSPPSSPHGSDCALDTTEDLQTSSSDSSSSDSSDKEQLSSAATVSIRYKCSVKLNRLEAHKSLSKTQALVSLNSQECDLDANEEIMHTIPATPGKDIIFSPTTYVNTKGQPSLLRSNRHHLDRRKANPESSNNIVTSQKISMNKEKLKSSAGTRRITKLQHKNTTYNAPEKGSNSDSVPATRSRRSPRVPKSLADYLTDNEITKEKTQQQKTSVSVASPEISPSKSVSKKCSSVVETSRKGSGSSSQSPAKSNTGIKSVSLTKSLAKSGPKKKPNSVIAFTENELNGIKSILNVLKLATKK